MSTSTQASVLLIYTGGTIGMIQNPDTGALESFNFDHLLRHVPEIRQFNLDIFSYAFLKSRQATQKITAVNR